MEFKKGLIYIVLAIYCTSSHTLANAEDDPYAIYNIQRDPKGEACEKKCDELILRVRLQLVRNGTSICFNAEPDDTRHSRTNVIAGEDPCYLDCTGQSAPDQTKCWCEQCKEDPRHFCKEIYGKSISKDECETLVCSGKGEAKYRRDWCDYEAEDRRAWEGIYKMNE